jgi:hypothetical protein
MSLEFETKQEHVSNGPILQHAPTRSLFGGGEMWGWSEHSRCWVGHGSQELASYKHQHCSIVFGNLVEKRLAENATLTQLARRKALLTPNYQTLIDAEFPHLYLRQHMLSTRTGSWLHYALCHAART